MKKWRTSDIIDLEYFLHNDAVSQSDENQQNVSERDRNIFLNSVLPAIKKDENPDRKFIIHTWLSKRRLEERHNAAVLPGESFDNLYSSFRFLFILAGLIFGGLAGLSFVTYTGDRPLNVFVYFSVFIVVQIVLLLLLTFLSIYRVKKRSFWAASPLYKIISRSMLRILLSARNRFSQQLKADQRNRVESILGSIKGKGRTYGFLVFLPLFILSQLFAIGCNLGLLTATLFKVVTADIAFGWQSTLQLSPTAVYSLVQKIALPWSWLGGDGLTFPSLTQIEGSRIILKEGIYHLSTPDLASWWPFLCLSVLFYGLLPRLLLFLAALAFQRKHLNSLDFKQGEYEQLLLRMTTPQVTTQGLDTGEPDAGLKEQAPDHSGKNQSPENDMSTVKNLLVMVPDDIFDACTREEVESVVNKRFVSTIQEILRINENYEKDTEILSTLKNIYQMEETDILVIQEAWQPPILEYINFIKNLRKSIGHGACIRIGLVGKPLANTIFTPVKDANRKLWEQKITAIGDPYIYAIRLVENVL